MTFSDPTPRREFGRKRGALALGCFLAVLSAHGRQSIGEEQQPAGGLRIGVLTYQDANDGMSSLERSLIGLREDAGLDEHFEVASGTYADLLHWLEIGAVNLAIVSPAILGKALELGGTVRWEYLASVRTAPDPSPSLSVARPQILSNPHGQGSAEPAGARSGPAPLRRPAIGVRRGGAMRRAGRGEHPRAGEPNPLHPLPHQLPPRSARATGRSQSRSCGTGCSTSPGWPGSERSSYRRSPACGSLVMS